MTHLHNYLLGTELGEWMCKTSCAWRSLPSILPHFLRAQSHVTYPVTFSIWTTTQEQGGGNPHPMHTQSQHLARTLKTTHWGWASCSQEPASSPLWPHVACWHSGTTLRGDSPLPPCRGGEAHQTMQLHLVTWRKGPSSCLRDKSRLAHWLMQVSSLEEISQDTESLDGGRGLILIFCSVPFSILQKTKILFGN